MFLRSIPSGSYNMNIVRIVSIMAIVLPASRPPLGAERRSERDYLVEALKQAESLYEKESWEAASLAYRKVLFVAPANRTARKRLKEITEKFSAELVATAEELWKKDRAQALEALKRAHAVCPISSAVKAAFKERDYVYRNECWLAKDQLKSFVKDDEDHGERRRRELGLPESFAIIRLGVVRIFTDIPPRMSKLKQMQTVFQTHYKTYQGFMAAFVQHYPEKGMDVVLYHRRPDFEKRTQLPDTAGVYIPAERASFFYLTGSGDDFNTLLHELTHQMNEQVLRAWASPAWFEEGIAEYFGHGYVTAGGKRITLGRATGYRLAEFLEAVRGNESAVIPLERFVNSSPDSSMFYAEAWAFVQYLLHGPAPGRFLAFDIISGSIENIVEGTPDLDGRWFAKAVSAYGLTMEELETDFLAYYREGRAK